MFKLIQIEAALLNGYYDLWQSGEANGKVIHIVSRYLLFSFIVKLNININCYENFKSP